MTWLPKKKWVEEQQGPSVLKNWGGGNVGLMVGNVFNPR